MHANITEGVKGKLRSFVYLIARIMGKCGEAEGSFTMLSALKLLFFPVGANWDQADGWLMGILGRFVAGLYGLVGLDEYDSISEQERCKIGPYGAECPGGVALDAPDGVELLDASLERLLSESPSIITYVFFDLVNLSCRWSCWQEAYSWAIQAGRRRESIPEVMIRYSTKYFRM